MRNITSHEQFWTGEFGKDYTERNQVTPDERIGFFANILGKTFGVQSICEFGANKGHNLESIHHLSLNYKLTGVDLNPIACGIMREKDYIEVVHSSLQDFKPAGTFDLVFTCGVLIHLNPDDLPMIYQKMFDSSSRYVLINEYYNTFPVELDYRGHAGKLFKRNFAGEFLDTVGINKARVIDYGFLWERLAPSWDDMTWFLIEKLQP